MACVSVWSALSASFCPTNLRTVLDFFFLNASHRVSMCSVFQFWWVSGTTLCRGVHDRSDPIVEHRRGLGFHRLSYRTGSHGQDWTECGQCLVVICKHMPLGRIGQPTDPHDLFALTLIPDLPNCAYDCVRHNSVLHLMWCASVNYYHHLHNIVNYPLSSHSSLSCQLSTNWFLIYKLNHLFKINICWNLIHLVINVSDFVFQITRQLRQTTWQLWLIVSYVGFRSKQPWIIFVYFIKCTF